MDSMGLRRSALCHPEVQEEVDLNGVDPLAWGHSFGLGHGQDPWLASGWWQRGLYPGCCPRDSPQLWFLDLHPTGGRDLLAVNLGDVAGWIRMVDVGKWPWNCCVGGHRFM